MEEKRSKKKDEILDEAARLFQQNGYKAASIRDIAEAVKIEPSSIYSHFKSKEEILVHICNYCATLFSKGIIEIINSSDSTLVQVESIIKLHIKIAFEEPYSSTVFSDEWRHLPEPDYSEFLFARKSYEKSIIKIVSKRIQELQLKVNAEIVVKTILSAIRWVHLYGHNNREKDRVNIEKDMIEVLTKALR